MITIIMTMMITAIMTWQWWWWWWSHHHFVRRGQYPLMIQESGFPSSFFCLAALVGLSPMIVCLFSTVVCLCPRIVCLFTENFLCCWWCFPPSRPSAFANSTFDNVGSEKGQFLKRRKNQFDQICKHFIVDPQMILKGCWMIFNSAITFSPPVRMMDNWSDFATFTFFLAYLTSNERSE